MRSDKGGCSTCQPGHEQHEEFTTVSGKTRVQYDYRTEDGILFSTIAKSLDAARQQRNRWLAEQETVSIQVWCCEECAAFEMQPRLQHHVSGSHPRCPDCGAKLERYEFRVRADAMGVDGDLSKVAVLEWYKSAVFTPGTIQRTSITAIYCPQCWRDKVSATAQVTEHQDYEAVDAFRILSHSECGDLIGVAIANEARCHECGRLVRCEYPLDF